MTRRDLRTAEREWRSTSNACLTRQPARRRERWTIGRILRALFR